jgi:hypothetical protein
MIKLIIYARDQEKHGPAAARAVLSLAPPRQSVAKPPR